MTMRLREGGGGGFFWATPDLLGVSHGRDIGAARLWVGGLRHSRRGNESRSLPLLRSCSLMKGRRGGRKGQVGEERERRPLPQAHPALLHVVFEVDGCRLTHGLISLCGNHLQAAKGSRGELRGPVTITRALRLEWCR